MVGHLSESKQWMILPQTKTVEGNEIEVPCKAIRYFPREKPDGELEFIPMKYWSFQVLVGHVKTGAVLKVKLTMVGTRQTGWRVQYPDRQVRNEWWSQETTTEKVDPFITIDDDVFNNYLNTKFGEDMANIILCLLLDTKAEEETAKAKAA